MKDCCRGLNDLILKSWTCENSEANHNVTPRVDPWEKISRINQRSCVASLLYFMLSDFYSDWLLLLEVNCLLTIEANERLRPARDFSPSWKYPVLWTIGNSNLQFPSSSKKKQPCDTICFRSTFHLHTNLYDNCLINVFSVAQAVSYYHVHRQRALLRTKLLCSLLTFAICKNRSRARNLATSGWSSRQSAPCLWFLVCLVASQLDNIIGLLGGWSRMVFNRTLHGCFK